MKNKNKKILNRKTAIIVGIVVLGLIMPKIVWANPIYELLGIFKAGSAMTAAAIGRAILVMISQFIFGFLNLLVRLSATFFDAMLKVGFTSHLNIVKAGWIVARDFSNMLFILFMIIIAFATILRTEKYGWRQLLPKIIIIALLINFSLVIASVIIDFSNITATFFIDETRKSIGGKTVAGKFTDSLNLLKTHMAFKCDDLSDKIPEGEEKSPRQICEENPTMAAAGQYGSDVMTFLISITMGSLVMLVTAFVFFAGAIMLLIRIIFIWFLVMVVPFVFMCYIMPALQQHWKKWWDRFLKWCFFAPVYAFFVWLAVKVAAEGKVQDLASSASNEIIGIGAIGNVFTSSPAMIIHYLFIIALLIGAIVAAKELSISGADTVMKLGQQAYRGIGRWTAARTRERAAKPMEKLAGGMAKLYGKTLGRIPGIKELGLGRIAQAPAQVMRAQQKAVAEEEKKLSTYSIATLKSLYPTFNRTQQIAAAQIMAEKGTLASEKDRFGREIGNFRERHIQKIIKVSNLYGEAMVKPLLINRLDLAPLVKKPWQNDQQAIEERLIKITPEKAGNIQYEAIKNPLFGDFIMEKMIQHFRPTHFAKIANVNVRVMNEITDQKFANPVYGATPINRKTHFEGINKPLADYIDGLMGQSVGWHF